LINDIKIAKEHMKDNNLNFVLVKDGKILGESNGRGIKPMYDAYVNIGQGFNDASVADRVIGKAAAMFLIEGNIKTLYTDLISDLAYDMLTKNGIEVEYGERVPMILNRTGDDMCPIEKLSSKSGNINELMENIDNFIENMKK